MFFNLRKFADKLFQLGLQKEASIIMKLVLAEESKTETIKQLLKQYERVLISTNPSTSLTGPAKLMTTEEWQRLPDHIKRFRTDKLKKIVPQLKKYDYEIKKNEELWKWFEKLNDLYTDIKVDKGYVSTDAIKKTLAELEKIVREKNTADDIQDVNRKYRKARQRVEEELAALKAAGYKTSEYVQKFIELNHIFSVSPRW